MKRSAEPTAVLVDLARVNRPELSTSKIPSSPKILLIPTPAVIVSAPTPPSTKLSPFPTRMLSPAPRPEPVLDIFLVRLSIKSNWASSPITQSADAFPVRTSAPTPPTSTANPPRLVSVSAEPDPDAVVVSAERTRVDWL